MYEDIIKPEKKTITLHGILRCPYCQGYKINRASMYTPADGTNIKEEVTCESCGKTWHLVWAKDAKKFIRAEVP